MILDPMFRRGVELEGGGRGASVGNAQWGKVKNLAAKYHFLYHTNICILLLWKCTVGQRKKSCCLPANIISYLIQIFSWTFCQHQILTFSFEMHSGQSQKVGCHRPNMISYLPSTTNMLFWDKCLHIGLLASSNYKLNLLLNLQSISGFSEAILRTQPSWSISKKFKAGLGLPFIFLQ